MPTNTKKVAKPSPSVELITNRTAKPTKLPNLMKTYLELFFCSFVLIANFSLFCTIVYNPKLSSFLSIFLRFFKMCSMYVMWFIMC